MTLRAWRRPERALWECLSPGALRPLLIAGLILSLPLVSHDPTTAQELPSTSAILVIYSGNRLLPSNLSFDESLRAALGASAGGSIEIWSEFLDEVRFPARYEERTRVLIHEKYGEHRPDLVVASSAPSLAFCLRQRTDLFDGIPIVFAGLGNDSLSRAPLPPGITGARSRFDAAATLRLALRLHPKTRQVFVIPNAGGIEGDSSIVDPAQLRESDFTLPLHRLTPEPLSRLLDDLASVPANSLVMDLSEHGSYGDPPVAPHEAMRRIADASRAPIYGIFDPLVGHGLVAAVATPVDASAHAAAALVRDILVRGEGEYLPAAKDLAATPIFDWRELRRWNLRKGQLPAGSLVRFEPLSFWRQHLLLVITASVLFLLQSGLILSLVLQSRRRRRAEIEVRRRREELAHMTRVATMGELTASLAHEINQPLTAILSNAQAAQSLLRSDGAHRAEVQEILSDIVADDQRAGEVIRRMRALLRKGEVNPVALDLNELVDEVVGIVHGEMILQNVSLELELSPSRLPIYGDRVQLEQVLLNLIVNALDALKEASGGSRKVIVRTQAIATDRSVEVSVQDNGVGLPMDMTDQIFEPFYTTKSQGLGLGLAICRSIIQTHGGRIGTRRNAGKGATFWFKLPATEENRA